MSPQANKTLSFKFSGPTIFWVLFLESRVFEIGFLFFNIMLMHINIHNFCGISKNKQNNKQNIMDNGEELMRQAREILERERQEEMTRRERDRRLAELEQLRANLEREAERVQQLIAEHESRRFAAG
jgi:hypothetical protein